jgi:hypothetical protein
VDEGSPGIFRGCFAWEDRPAALLGDRHRSNATGEIDGNARCVELGIKNAGGRDWADESVHRHIHTAADELTFASLSDEQLAALDAILEAALLVNSGGGEDGGQG